MEDRRERKIVLRGKLEALRNLLRRMYKQEIFCVFPPRRMKNLLLLRCEASLSPPHISRLKRGGMGKERLLSQSEWILKRFRVICGGENLVWVEWKEQTTSWQFPSRYHRLRSKMKRINKSRKWIPRISSNLIFMAKCFLFDFFEVWQIGSLTLSWRVVNGSICALVEIFDQISLRNFKLQTEELCNDVHLLRKRFSTFEPRWFVTMLGSILNGKLSKYLIFVNPRKGFESLHGNQYQYFSVIMA